MLGRHGGELEPARGRQAVDLHHGLVGDVLRLAREDEPLPHGEGVGNALAVVAEGGGLRAPQLRGGLRLEEHERVAAEGLVEADVDVLRHGPGLRSLEVLFLRLCEVTWGEKKKVTFLGF